MALRASVAVALLGLAVSPAASAQAAPDGLALSLNCSTCHGLDGKSPGTVPSLKGMPAAQLVPAFQQFRSGEGPATIMNRIAKGLPDTETAAIAGYWSGLK